MRLRLILPLFVAMCCISVAFSQSGSSVDDLVKNEHSSPGENDFEEEPDLWSTTYLDSHGDDAPSDPLFYRKQSYYDRRFCRRYFRRRYRTCLRELRYCRGRFPYHYYGRCRYYIIRGKRSLSFRRLICFKGKGK